MVGPPSGQRRRSTWYHGKLSPKTNPCRTYRTDSRSCTNCWRPDHRSRLPHAANRLPPSGAAGFDALTAWEQLRHVARLHGISDDEADSRIETLLDRFGLLADADKRIESYSTGMTKKVGIIAALFHDPDMVFLDEPTSGLDPRAARTVRDTIADLVTREMTVFLSTHILLIVDELADTIGVINDGTLVAEARPSELKSQADESLDLETAFPEVTGEQDTTVRGVQPTVSTISRSRTHTRRWRAVPRGCTECCSPGRTPVRRRRR